MLFIHIEQFFPDSLVEWVGGDGGYKLGKIVNASLPHEGHNSLIAEPFGAFVFILIRHACDGKLEFVEKSKLAIKPYRND